MNIIKLNIESNILTEKYAPSNSKEIIGCKKQKYAIIDWLKKYRTNAKLNLIKNNNKKIRKRKIQKEKFKSDNDSESIENIHIKKKKDPNICSCMVITGDHGTGKTAVVIGILNGLGYQIRTVNFQKINNNRNIDDFIKNLLIKDNIYDSIQNKNIDKVAIVIDEIESITTPTEKNVIIGLMKINSECWGCPIIFIGSNKHRKILSIIKKECYHIAIYEPTLDDLTKLLERVGLGEKMKMEDENVAYKIIEHSQRDYRRLIITLGELKRIYGTNIITNKYLDKYIEYSVPKDVDRTIYEHTSYLFSKYYGINNALKIFEHDKSNMPLMIHQNYILALNNYINEKSKTIELAKEISEVIAKGDIIDNYIYSEQNWNLQEIHGFYTCIYPNYKITQNINTDRLNNDSKYPIYKPNFSPDYPKDLNRTSTRCINYRKNVKIANEYFTDMTINDYVFASKLIKKLLEDNRIKTCENIISKYKLPSQGIIYILKIDKIKGTKKDISKNIEKKVKQISIEPIKSYIIKK